MSLYPSTLIKKLNPNIPQSVENIILKAAAKNPKNRYNDARAMYEDLKTCLDESRVNEDKWEYQFAELDSDNKIYFGPCWDYDGAFAEYLVIPASNVWRCSPRIRKELYSCLISLVVL